MAVAGGPERSVEIRGIFLRLRGLQAHRREVTPSPEPAAGGDQHAGIEVGRGHFRALHVRDQADAAGPEARVLGCTGDLGTKFGGELPPDRGDIDPDLLENPPLHDAHHPAASVRAILGGPAPCRLLEASRLSRPSRLLLDRIEGRAQPVAQ